MDISSISQTVMITDDFEKITGTHYESSEDTTLSSEIKEVPVMGRIYQGGVPLVGGVAVLQDAQDVPFDHTSNAMEADNVQAAIEEVHATAKSAWEAVQKFHMVATIPSQNGSLTYTGSAQSPSWNGYDTEKLTLGGVISGIAAGTYAATFTPKTGYAWSDGTTTAKNVIWSIRRANLSNVLPTQSGSLTYTGRVQSPSWSGYDSTKLTLGGETSGTNAGSYTATFAPTSNYRWSDGTLVAKNVTWSIGKANGTLSLSKSSVELTKATTSDTFTVSRSGTGAISAVSHNTGIATVSVSGTTVTVTCVDAGSTSITVSVAEDSNYNAPASATCAVSVDLTSIYGVSWDGTSTTALIRTDTSAGFTDPVPAVSNGTGSSPFDDLMPWSGVVKETDSAAGVLVKIPKFWYKWTKSGNTLKLQIADGAADGFYVSPAHADRGDGKGERDYIYVGRYHCATGTYQSTTGVAQVYSVTRSNARSNIHNLGSSYWQFDYATRLTIQMLYLVEFANWDSQTKIGYGCSASGSKENNGQTDAMQYHTGTTASSRDTYGFTQYRWIEGLWDNVFDWMDGCYYNDDGMNIILNPENFSDDANGTSIGTPASGWISAFDVVTSNGVQWIIPSDASGSQTTYIPDEWAFGSSSPCLRVGGNYTQGMVRGIFCVYYSPKSNKNSGVGCRLIKLP